MQHGGDMSTMGQNPKEKSAEPLSNSGHTIAPMQFNFGEVQTLVEIAKEFNSKQVKVKIHETASARFVDVRTDTPERSKFIEFLIRRLRDCQDKLRKANPDLRA